MFLQGEPKSKYTDLPPVVSQPIYDKKAMADLVIVKLSDCVCSVDGGNKDIILLCEKVYENFGIHNVICEVLFARLE